MVKLQKYCKSAHNFAETQRGCQHLNSTGGGGGGGTTLQLFLSPGAAGKPGAPLGGGGQPGPVAGQILLFEQAARGRSTKRAFKASPRGRLSPPGEGLGLHVGSQASSSAPELSSPHPTLPLRYFSMTGARGHFRRGGGVPLAWFISSFRPRPSSCSAYISAPASSHGYPPAVPKESRTVRRLGERRHGPAG